MTRAVLVVAAAVAVGWLAAPWVSMWRHGTIDQQTVQAWKEDTHER